MTTRQLCCLVALILAALSLFVHTFPLLALAVMILAIWPLLKD